MHSVETEATLEPVPQDTAPGPPDVQLIFSPFEFLTAFPTTPTLFPNLIFWSTKSSLFVWCAIPYETKSKDDEEPDNLKVKIVDP